MESALFSIFINTTKRDMRNKSLVLSRLRKIGLLVILQVLVLFLHAQVTISGKLKDNKGRALPGVSISIKDSYDGTIVDSLGNYGFTTTEKGEHILSATNIGYKSFEEKIVIGNTPIVKDISLKEELSELKAVTVVAGSFAAGD